jgi:uncharacterized protein YktA (UPF0223 family)
MLKEILEEKRLNESSSISALGATKEQIKTIYSNISKNWSKVVPNAKAKFTAKTKKKEVTDLMRSKGANAAVVVGFNNTTMYYAIQTKSLERFNGKIENEYKIYQIDSDGSKVAEWSESSAIKALSYFNGVKTYYISEKGATKAQATDDYGYDDSPNNNVIVNKLAKLIEEDMKILFEKSKKIFTQKISQKIDSGDLIGAQKMLNKFVSTKSTWNSEDNYVEKEFSDFIKDSSGWSSVSVYQQIKNAVAKNKRGHVPTGFGSISDINNLTITSSEKDIRLAAVEVLKFAKEKINSLIEG